MEQFNEPHHKIREKSVYLLHLDVPRIILISLAIIGVIVTSFLLGMNFIHSESNDIASLNENDPLLNKSAELPLVTPDLPEPPTGDEKGNKIDEGIIGDGKITADDTAPQKDLSADIVTPDTVHEVITPQKNTEKAHHSVNKHQTKEVEHKTVSHQKSKTRPKDRKRKDKQKVVEVAAQNEDSHAKMSGFAIQVVSYDSKSKANTEVQRLKSMDYDAYIDKSTVNGKRFYRVRIGPITSHAKAEKLLKDIQEEDRYEKSYIIHE